MTRSQFWLLSSGFVNTIMYVEKPLLHILNLIFKKLLSIVSGLLLYFIHKLYCMYCMCPGFKYTLLYGFLNGNPTQNTITNWLLTICTRIHLNILLMPQPMVRPCCEFIQTILVFVIIELNKSIRFPSSFPRRPLTCPAPKYVYPRLFVWVFHRKIRSHWLQSSDAGCASELYERPPLALNSNCAHVVVESVVNDLVLVESLRELNTLRRPFPWNITHITNTHRNMPFYYRERNI